MTLVLEGMSPAQEQGWLVLLDLFQNRRNDWTLIGGQMMYLLALENSTGLGGAEWHGMQPSRLGHGMRKPCANTPWPAMSTPRPHVADDVKRVRNWRR